MGNANRLPRIRRRVVDELDPRRHEPKRRLSGPSAAIFAYLVIRAIAANIAEGDPVQAASFRAAQTTPNKVKGFSLGRSHQMPLTPAFKNRSHHPRITPAMNHCKYPQRSFIWSVCDQIVVGMQKSETARIEIRASMPRVRKCYCRLNAPLNLANHTVGIVHAVFGDVLPDVVQINLCFRMKIVSGHASSERLAALLAANRAMTSSPGTSFTLPFLTSS